MKKLTVDEKATLDLIINGGHEVWGVRTSKLQYGYTVYRLVTISQGKVIEEGNLTLRVVEKLIRKRKLLSKSPQEHSNLIYPNKWFEVTSEYIPAIN